MKVLRLDQLLVERGIAESREKARELILGGKVLVKGLAKPKPSSRVREDVHVRILEEYRFVSRGGYKLQGFLEELERELGFKVEGFRCLDIGASTGGFTHCLLHKGASKVYALDVSKGQLHLKLREDPRVIPIEGFNARYLSPESFQAMIGEEVDLITIDVSFISLRLILKAIADTFKGLNFKKAYIIALIKPQFELGPDKARGGVVRDISDILSAVREVLSYASQLGLVPLYLKPSKLKGTKGNQEIFALLSFSEEGYERKSLNELLRGLEKDLRERELNGND